MNGLRETAKLVPLKRRNSYAIGIVLVPLMRYDVV
jgi:hypothetical protein